MLPSLREERAQTSRRSPHIAAHGIVLQVPVVGHDAKAGTITTRIPTAANASRRRDGRQSQAAMGSRTGRCAGLRSASNTRCGQGPDRLVKLSGEMLARLARRRRRVSTMSFS